MAIPTFIDAAHYSFHKCNPFELAGFGKNKPWCQRKQVPIIATAALACTCYLAAVRYYRYQSINALRRKYPDPNIVLKDSDIAAEIFDTTTRKEFPALDYLSFNMALFRSVASPPIGRLLVATGEVVKHAHKRAEDSDLLLHEMLDVYPHIQYERREDPDGSEDAIKDQTLRWSHAVARMNEIHSHYRIANEEFLYQLVLFVSEPIYWIDKFGWRKLDQREKNAIFRIWYDIAMGMGLEDVPHSPEKMIEFQEKYALAYVKPFSAGWKAIEGTVLDVCSDYPKFLHTLIRRLFPCMLAPYDNDAFSLEQPSFLIKTLFNSYLYIHKYYLRYFKFPRTTSIYRTPDRVAGNNRYRPLWQSKNPTYPEGYTLSDIGPTKFKSAVCPVPHIRSASCPVLHH